jgi:hypothetical protein
MTHQKIKLCFFLNETKIIALFEVGAPTHPEWEIIPFWSPDPIHFSDIMVQIIT